MNFIHFGDTHLGGSNFKLPEREQDYLDAFSQVIDYALREKPDFIIHSGDLFDRGKPGNKILLFVIKQLKRLKEAGIPFITIAGSHDVSVDGTFITILEKVGLLINASSKENYVKSEKGIIVKGIDVGNATVYGVPGRRANIKAIYDSLLPEPSDKFKIFIFHHIISNVSDASDFADIPLRSLPPGMDYYAGGHWHEHEEFSYNGKPVIYPGSTEFTDIDSMARGKERGFIHYKKGPEFVKLKTRKVEVREVNCNNLSPEEATSKCLSELKESNGALIVLKLNGTLRTGKRNEINVSQIVREALSKGYLHCNVRISNVNNPGENILSARPVNEMEKEFLSSRGYSEKEIMVAQQLIDILGNNYTPDELEKAIIRAGELL